MKLKNIAFVLNVVLFVCVIVLFILHFSSTKSNTSNSPRIVKTDTTNTKTDIAYVNVDTLLKNYNLYKDLEAKLITKQKSMEADLNYKMAAFEREAGDFQRKVQSNSFLSQESAQRQEQELMVKQQNLYKLREDLSGELMKESQTLEKQLLDTITNFLKEYNKEYNYKYIFNSATLLYGNKGADISKSVLDRLNERYSSKEKSK